MAETTPERLLVALTAAGWFEEGRRRGHVRLRWGTNPDSLVVPTDTTAPEYEAMMTAALTALERAADYGSAAELAHTLATCSCGGKRWVDDKGWQPDYQATTVRPRREPGDGLIPCGNCNEGGWNTPLGEVSDPPGSLGS